MNLTAAISADIRARANYLPHCPLCSFVGVADAPDVFRGPSFREFRGQHRLTACCSLSECDEVFETQGDAAAWWREKRMQDVPCPATNNRRRNCLLKLEFSGLEAIR